MDVENKKTRTLDKVVDGLKTAAKRSLWMPPAYNTLFWMKSAEGSIHLLMGFGDM